MPYGENDPEQKIYLAELMEGLAKLGWTDGDNLHIDIRWVVADVGQVEKYAKELVALRPEVIVSVSTPVTAAFQRTTGTIPIVFVGVSDPVGAGFVDGLARPGANLTGFINLEAGMGGKWLELLTQVAPAVRQAAFIFSPYTTNASYYRPSFELAAQSLGVGAVAASVRNAAEIESTIVSFAREGSGGLVFPPDFLTNVHRALIVSVAATSRLPTIFGASVFVREGGLISYGPDRVDLYARAATYVDRILRGAQPPDLPVQVPVKYEMALNLKTAKALDIAVPPSILLRADTVIE
jgi:putative tryptophan/tyrosine transport system substrate-binding protein